MMLIKSFIFFGATYSLVAEPTYRNISFDCGGYFSGFAVHASGRLYGFGDVFGMWRSDNAGQSFRYLQGNFRRADTFVNGCAVARGNADSVVFLTDASVYGSDDGGSTWKKHLAHLFPRRDRGATPLIFHPNNDSELWLASARSGLAGTLWRSTDGGTTWSKMGGTTFDQVVATTINMRPEYPNQIWVGAVGGLYVSANRGNTFSRVWSNVGGVTPFMNELPTVAAIARRADGVGYIATNTKGWRITAIDYAKPTTYLAKATVSDWAGWGPTNATVLADGSFLTQTSDSGIIGRSTDGGRSWTNLRMSLVTPPTPVWSRVAGPGTRTGYGSDMIVQDPTRPARWFMTGGAAPLITNDSGTTWKYPPAGNGLSGVPTFKVRFSHGNSRLAFIPAADMGAFTVRGTIVTHCLRTSIDRLQTCHDVLPSDDGRSQVIAGVDQVNNSSLLARTNDGGASWTPLRGYGLPRSYEGITRAIARPGNLHDFLVLLGSDPSKANNNPGLYRTLNGGASFTRVIGIPDGVDTGSRYHPENSWLESDGANIRYLSLRSASDPSARGFWRSTDGGSTWAKTRGQPFGDDWILCMAVDRATAGRVWVAGGYRGIQRSDDGGNTWLPVGDFFDNATTKIDAVNGHIAIWGRRTGDTWSKLYYSADNGATWTHITGPGHRCANLSDLAVDPHHPRRIWVSGMGVTVIDPSDTNVIQNLDQ